MMLARIRTAALATTMGGLVANGNTILVMVVGGSNITVAWTEGMNAQQALERAYIAVGDPQRFTYALQFFGKYGYLVVMLNETFETFVSTASPNYYWEFLVNGFPATAGIDGVILNAGDAIQFELQAYVPARHDGTGVGIKHRSKAAVRL